MDDVLAYIDRGIEEMPTYRDLNDRWERQQLAYAFSSLNKRLRAIGINLSA